MRRIGADLPFESPSPACEGEHTNTTFGERRSPVSFETSDPSVGRLRSSKRPAHPDSSPQGDNADLDIQILDSTDVTIELPLPSVGLQLSSSPPVQSSGESKEKSSREQNSEQVSSSGFPRRISLDKDALEESRRASFDTSWISALKSRDISRGNTFVDALGNPNDLSSEDHHSESSLEPPVRFSSDLPRNVRNGLAKIDFDSLLKNRARFREIRDRIRSGDRRFTEDPVSVGSREIVDKTSLGQQSCNDLAIRRSVPASCPSPSPVLEDIFVQRNESSGGYGSTGVVASDSTSSPKLSLSLPAIDVNVDISEENVLSVEREGERLELRPSAFSLLNETHPVDQFHSHIPNSGSFSSLVSSEPPHSRFLSFTYSKVIVSDTGVTLSSAYELHGHVIVYGIDSIEELIYFIDPLLVDTELACSVVILSPHIREVTKTYQSWLRHFVAPIHNLFYFDGSALRESDLLAVNVRAASRVVILNPLPKISLEDANLCDANAILALRSE